MQDQPELFDQYHKVSPAPLHSKQDCFHAPLSQHCKAYSAAAFGHTFYDSHCSADSLSSRNDLLATVDICKCYLHLCMAVHGIVHDNNLGPLELIGFFVVGVMQLPPTLSAVSYYWYWLEQI